MSTGPGCGNYILYYVGFFLFKCPLCLPTPNLLDCTHHTAPFELLLLNHVGTPRCLNPHLSAHSSFRTEAGSRSRKKWGWGVWKEAGSGRSRKGTEGSLPGLEAKRLQMDP